MADDVKPALTARQAELLSRIALGACYLAGADARVAQALAKKGLIDLDDNGVVCPDGRHSDGERFFARLAARAQAPAQPEEG